MGKQVTSGQLRTTKVVVSEYSKGRIQKSTTYTDDTRATMVEEMICTWDESALIRTIVTEYGADGVTKTSVSTTDYFEEKLVGGGKKIIKKES